MNSAALEDIRAALVVAVASDIRRRRRRRLAATIGTAALLLVVVATGTAAGTGWLYGAPAPAKIANDMRRFEKSVPPPRVRDFATSPVPLGQPVEVAKGGGFTLYLLRTTEHECYEVEPNAGELCGPAAAGTAPVELLGFNVHADPRVKEDPTLAGKYGGGDVYGRTSAAGAASVEIRIPGTNDPVTASVDPRTGYFVGAIGAAAGTPLLDDDSSLALRTALAGWPVVVRDAAGRVVARSGP